MYRSLWRFWLAFPVLVAVAVNGPRPVQAGPILDWLFGPSTPTTPPVVAYYPPASASHAMPSTSLYPAQAVAPATTVYRAPTTTWQTPVSQVYAPAADTTTLYRPTSGSDACCPQPVACAPQGVAGYTVPVATAVPVQAPRQTLYRTTWSRVPVTQYRPVVSTDPITGCPVTVMQPCTTYTWQPQRRRCGFFGRLFGLCDPGPAATVCPPVCPQVCPPDPCMSACVMTSDCCGGGWSAPVASSGTPTPAAPYYEPGSAMPSAGSAGLPPAGAATPQLSPDTMPQSGVMPPQGAVRSPEPADLRPSLVPGAPGSGSSAPRSPGSAGASPAPQGAGMNSAASGNWSANAPPRTTLSQPVPLPQREGSAYPSEGRTPSPVPDPDAIPAHNPDTHDAPQLLDPNDQVATLRVRQAWAYTNVSWPGERRVSRGTPIVSPTQQVEELDDSGWRSIAP